MNESRRGPFGWLRGWLRRDSRGAAPAPGEVVITSGQRALRAVESQLGSVVIESEHGGEGSVRAQLGAAAGRALLGQRVALFAPADALAACRDQLAALAERRVPLVVHATFGGPSPPGSGTGGELADALVASGVGWPTAVAASAQEAVDLTLIARRLAEERLTPVLVAGSGPATLAGPARLHLPATETVEDLAGNASDTISCATEGEQLLFGPTRRRLPRWLDLGAPVAIGGVRSGPDRGLGELGRRLLLDAALEGAITRSLGTVAILTSRPLATVSTHRLDGARLVLVTRGALVEPARAAVDALRGQRRRVGLVTLTWAHPLDVASLKWALRGAARVAVLEAPGGDDPLAQVVAASVGASLAITRVGVVGGWPLRASALMAAAANLLSSATPPRQLVLGLAAGELRSSFPRREVLLQATRRALRPQLEGGGQPTGDDARRARDPRPPGAATVVWWGPPDDAARSALTRLARGLAASGRRALRTRWREAADHAWVARLTVAADDFEDPGDETPVDVAVLAGETGPAWVDPLEGLVPSGAIVVACRVGGQDHGRRPPPFPPSIEQHGGGDAAAAVVNLTSPPPRRSVEGGQGGGPSAVGSAATWLRPPAGARLFTFEGETDALADAVAWLVGGAKGEKPEGLEAVAAETRQPPAPSTPGDDEVPAVVRRHRLLKERYDNLPRFWGELVQPRVAGEGPAALPDPLVALGAVPANAASLFDRSRGRRELPVFTAAHCTGCSRCWTSCPDGALAPVALRTEAWLRAGLKLAVPAGAARDPAAGKLDRALPQLAKRLDGQLAKPGERVVTAEAVREAFEWLLEKMAPGDDEGDGMERALDGALAALGALEPALTAPFAGLGSGGSGAGGALLMLAVDPRACQACGVCVAECSDGALALADQTEASLAAARAGWHLWEALPDTPGEVVEQVQKRSEVGPLGAAMLSRHVTATLAGADGAEPGSGERLAARQVTAVVELARQRALVRTAGELEELVGALNRAVRDQLGEALAGAAPAHLDAALHRAAGAKLRLADVVSGLEAEGERPLLDPLVTERADAAQAVEAVRQALVEGPEGLGQARFAVVLDRIVAESWGARFPRNPFGAPVAVALDGDTASLAVGVAEGLVAEWLAVVRTQRWGELALKAPSVAKANAEREALAGLQWGELSAEERAACPPVVVLAAAESLLTGDLNGLSRLLRSALPVLIVLTDGRGVPDGVDPVLFALAHREAFVLSTSVAHPDHLFEGVTAALGEERPALVHVYAPSPGRHGFEPEATVARARLAVTSRVHPLVRYDPDAEGVFGTRLALAGNEEPEAAWVADEAGELWRPSRWAAGEARFEDVGAGFDEAWGHRWRLLQELAGVVTPFTERVRAVVTEEMEATRRHEVDALVAEYEARMAEREASQQAVQASTLRDRLLALAGYDPSRLPRRGGDEPLD